MNAICILRLSAIGDVTHVIPVILSLQEQLPGTQLTWVIGRTEAKLVGGLPGVEFITFDKKAGLHGYRELFQKLRGRQFDALLHMQVAMRANLAAALVPARLRIGYDRARSKDLHSLFINRRIPTAPRQHVRDCLASFLEPLGLEPAPARWQLPLSSSDREWARQHIAESGPNIVISPYASHPLRNWLPERYAALADYAIKHYGARVILVGSPAEQEAAFISAIERRMTETPLNLVGQDTLKQLAALLEAANLVVSPDTGPAHIANAMGTDVLGLYAGSNPHRSGPYNSLEWCVNRYPQALEHFTGKTPETAPWGAKAEYEGAMAFIETADVTAKLDQWMAERYEV